MTEKIDVAVVGATGLVGEAIVQQLEAREFPVGRLFLLGRESATGKSQLFREKWVHVQPLEGFDFSQVSLVFLAVPAEASLSLTPGILAAGCHIVDASAAYRLDDEIPCAVAGTLEMSEARQVVSPGAVPGMLAPLLQALQRRSAIRRVDVHALLAVSTDGRSRVDELAGQTVNLLSSKPVKAKHYPKQIAFNVLPRVAPPLAGGYVAEELQIVAELRRLTGLPALEVYASTVRVPVFFGHTADVRVVLEEPVAAEEAIALFKRAAGVQWMDTDKPSGFPSPAVEAAGKEQILVTAVRTPLFASSELHFRVVCDNLRKGSALNCVQLAECLRISHP